ncbi:MAG: NAD(P)/FAD-dependent oxidoreductase [Acutalibacteraceae bacterium]
MTAIQKIFVVGGGAAGLMAAIHASMPYTEVTVFERNKTCGKKILITGKGRCNVTNNCDVQTVLANTPTNARFLYSALNAFTPSDTIDFFEAAGVKLKTERGNRVFPQSDKASDIAEALYRSARQNDCRFIHEKVIGLIINQDSICGVKTDKNKTYMCDKVILACGGASYPATGSTGEGYALAQQAGHTVIPLKPSLVPLTSHDTACREMMGLSLKNIAISITDKDTKKTVYEDFGEMLFTHFGVSGPVILSASTMLKNMRDGKYILHINLKPALTAEQLNARLIREFENNKNKDFSNILPSLLPAKMIPIIVRRSNISSAKKCCQITKEERYNLIAILKSFDITISGFRPIEEAIITSGGVNIKEINPKTMESKLIQNLYFAGEMIDVDAYTGGFNLQIAFATGFLAGNNAAL